MARTLLLLVLLCGGSALARRPLAQAGCAEGPTFWCRSPETAAQCGAVQLCAQAGRSQAAEEDMCADCQQIITILTRMAKESAFKGAIQKFLTHQCTTLPLSSLVPHCQKLVDTYFGLFLACLEGQIKPDSLCAKLDLCPTDPTQEQGPEPPASLSPEKWILPLLQGLRLDLPDSRSRGGAGEDLPIPLPMCWMCRSFVGRIEATVPKEAIAKSMSQLCRLLPGTVGGACRCLMEKYTVTVLDLILGRLGPRLLCGMLFLCATGENCGPELPPVPLPDQSPACQACLAVTGLATAAVRANSSAAEVEAALLGACGGGAPRDWQECESFVERHRARLLPLLPKAWDPRSTCQELAACGAGPGPEPGAKGCALGPAYWCSSPEAAKRCQALQHCQAHGWA